MILTTRMSGVALQPTVPLSYENITDMAKASHSHYDDIRVVPYDSRRQQQQQQHETFSSEIHFFTVPPVIGSDFVRDTSRSVSIPQPGALFVVF